eukprot:CAMPEP_0194262610 /NCGR_PEP_ID=MMETSP0158-20130606/46633_1 /TAXON_ID=33649 /ORGANISM="Thalassionema nitzschioides, Strain L26-B" /LENGTH=522 /DNA_ID=CAMNT_0039002769 /DNA_START=162 /DNA_END=1730 /DNA_ORIENTATION=-
MAPLVVVDANSNGTNADQESEMPSLVESKVNNQSGFIRSWEINNNKNEMAHLIAVNTNSNRTNAAQESEMASFVQSKVNNQTGDTLITPAPNFTTAEPMTVMPTGSPFYEATNNTDPTTQPSTTILETFPRPTPVIPAATNATKNLQSITIPWTNVSTVGWKPGRFDLGFRNQIMAFSTVVMKCGLSNWSQILLPTIRHTDTYGSELLIGFDELFDVEHWNKQYPLLPRMVDCNQTIFTNYDCANNMFIQEERPNRKGNVNNNNLYSIDKQPYQFAKYKEYSHGAGKMARPVFPNPMDLAMTMGGLRPHPDLQRLIDSMISNFTQNNNRINDDDDASYITLHARIEPDMQVQPFCLEKKVLNLTDIFQALEDAFPTAPVKYVFMPINRQILEKEGTIHTNSTDDPDTNATTINWMAVHNLKALNQAVEFGLWNGTVKIFEFGANALKGTRYEERSSITGSVVNFYIGINCKIFVGSEVSSYAIDLLKHRFHRNLTSNFKYLPSGLEDWTPPGTVQPPGFQCR